ncbi:probable ATP-dependent RNA helicase DDX27 [Hydra vulgaris]|uniref:RNA helicase n=1 Tax=Hydra vulgaris TaxID=6087 RepID=A0ABM4DP18_HYDVU
MANFLSIKTLESDDDESLILDESDVDEEISKSSKKIKKKKGLKEDFASDFQFSLDNSVVQQPWKISTTIKKSAKGQDSADVIEDQIHKKVQERKEKKSDKSGAVKEKEDNFNSVTDADEIGSEQYESEDEDVKSDGESEGNFFMHAPPLVKREFIQMNLSRPLLKAINELGFEHPTKIQSSTIPIALLGKDLCACATTGSGKTAAFMLPILERLLFKPKQTAVVRVLILVPTRELAIQVYSVSESLAKFSNIQLGLATGGLDSRSQEAILRKNPDIVIATPGRLIDHLHNTPSFNLQTIEILVLDEADRMLEEHFHDQMKEIIRLCPRGRQTMLFSATMTDEVSALMSLSLNNPVKLFVDQNTDVASSLHQEFVRIRSTREADRLAVVVALCCRSFNQQTLVFLQTKVLAHKLRIIFGLFGLKAAELHGNLTQLQRLEALEKFKNNEVDILVATDLAARGLDIVGVKTVISFNMPSTIKSYIHRVGRTARAGKAGRSITLVGEKERKMLKEVVKNAKIPVKNRILSTEVVEKYKIKLESFEKDIKEILKEEESAKQLRVAEMEMNKAKNLIEHHDEIMSRPAKTFIKTQKQSSAKNRKESQKKVKNLTEEEKKIRREQMFHARQIKRNNKPKRIRAFDENAPDVKGSRGPKHAKIVPSQKTFDRELTDTSKKSLQALRSNTNFKKKTSSGFKSKKRFKRK